MKAHLILIVALLLLTGFLSAQDNKASVSLAAAIYEEEVTGSLDKATELYQNILKKYPEDRAVAAKTLYHLGLVNEKMGKQKAGEYFRQLVNSYPDQKEMVALAKKKLVENRTELLDKQGDNEFSIKRVKELPGMGVLGTVSPDGRYLLYSEDGSLDLSIYETATGIKRTLVKGDIESDAYTSRWSPDGKLVAYTWYHDNGQMDLRVIGSDGTGTRVLYSGDNRVSWLDPEDWSPDGNTILTTVYHEHKTSQLLLVSVRDGSVRLLKDFGNLSPGPSRFSPDGRYVAYTVQQISGSKEKDIFIVSLEGKSEIPLVHDPADDIFLDWTPNGRGILFRSDRTGSAGIWWTKVSEGKSVGNPELIKPDLGPDFKSMGFTRNGSYYYGTQKEMKDVFIAALDLNTGKLISAPRLATQRFAGSNYFPEWSADGKQLLYLSQRTPGVWEARTLCVRSTDSGEIHELGSRVNVIGWVRWSPDGHSLLALAAKPKGGYGTFRIDIQTGDYELLMTPHIGWPATWSRDGKSIYAIRCDSVTNGVPIVVKDLETGKEKILYDLSFSDSSHYVTGPALSPDGKQLAFAVSESGSRIIKIVPAEGGEARELLRGDSSVMSFGFGTIAWTPDGRNILFVRTVNSGGSETGLWMIPITGGEPRKLELKADNVHDLSVHPDGKHIAFTASKTRSEIWVMENFLPKEKIEANNQLTLRKLDYAQINIPNSRISADGRFISYTDWNTGNLAVYDVATGVDRRLTNKDSWASSGDNAGYSLFSPDSKQLVFTWKIWAKSQTELRITGTDGSQQRVIYTGDEPWPMSWSPNGKFILVKLMNKDQTWRPAMITVSDGSIRDLPLQIAGAMYFSPDGKYIAYDVPQTNNAGLRDIFLYELSAKRSVPLVKHPADDSLLGWAPDGKHLLFNSDRSGTRDAWLIAVSGGNNQGEPTMIRKNIGNIEGIGFTLPGDYYFQEQVEGHNIYTSRLDPDTGKLLSPPVEIAGSFLGANWRPDFSADGRFLAYISNRGSGDEQGNAVVIRSLDTGKERLLRPALQLGFGLRWAPDGLSLFVNGTDNTKMEGLFRVDAQTGEAHLIVENHFVGIPGLDVSPDGSRIYYTAVAGSGIPDGAGAYDVRHYVYNLQTGKEKELIRPGNTPLVPLALSPDGEQLAFIGTGDKPGSVGICIMPALGGPSKQLVNIGTPGWASRVIAFSPDGRYIIYAVILPKKHETNMGLTSWELWRISLQGGEPQRLDLQVDGLLRHLRIHPDGQQIVYYTWRGGVESWVMENFFPK